MSADVLRAALSTLGPLPAPAVDAWVALAEARAYAPGEWLLRGGDRATTCHWVVRGLVRELYVSAEGEEHTRAFVAEGGATGSLLDLLSGAPAVTWIEALEPTETYAWPWAAQEALAERFPAVHQLMRRVAEALYVRKAQREHQMLALTAEQRYSRWCADHPALDRRVLRRHLASYLGISPEHLSRIARRATP
ncbi:MAG: Crp/Fnr family transcriptional regulator [Myxococcota bacterium]